MVDFLIPVYLSPPLGEQSTDLCKASRRFICLSVRPHLSISRLPCRSFFRARYLLGLDKNKNISPIKIYAAVYSTESESHRGLQIFHRCHSFVKLSLCVHLRDTSQQPSILHYYPLTILLMKSRDVLVFSSHSFSSQSNYRASFFCLKKKEEASSLLGPSGLAAKSSCKKCVVEETKVVSFRFIYFSFLFPPLPSFSLILQLSALLQPLVFLASISAGLFQKQRVYRQFCIRKLFKLFSDFTDNLEIERYDVMTQSSNRQALSSCNNITTIIRFRE